MKRTLTIVALVLMATAGFSQQVASRAKAMRMMSFSRPEYLIKDIKETLGEKVADVKVSQRLKTSAVCLVADEMGPSLSMEQTFAEMDNPLFKAKRILELNPHHDLFGRLQKLHEAGKDSQDFKDYCDLLYTQALLIEGILPENPVDFANKVAKLMAK